MCPRNKAPPACVAVRTHSNVSMTHMGISCLILVRHFDNSDALNAPKCVVSETKFSQLMDPILIRLSLCFCRNGPGVVNEILPNLYFGRGYM